MLVVTPNPCFDRTLRVERFAVGSVARPHRVDVTAGGKGVNVLRTATDLGAPARLVVLAPRRDRDAFAALLAEEGLTAETVDVDGALRSATIVLEDDGRATVLNEPGPTLGAAELDALLQHVDASAGSERVVVCSGSLPPGLPDDAYGRVVDAARARGSLVVVDGARAALAAALPHRPDAVCPNLHEAEGLTTGAVLEPADDAGPDEVRERALRAADRLHREGVEHAIVTAGAVGAALVDRDGGRWFDAHPVDVVNPIGAGDSFVAGLAAALEAGAAWDEALRRAVATAAAAVEVERAGRVDRHRVAALLAPAEVAR